MTANPHSVPLSALQTAKLLAAEFALTAVERDERGGTPKAERDALRQSGLLALSIPGQYGGLGARWSETLDVVREFAKVDSSIAHVFGFHHLMLATVRLFSRPDQWQPWFEQTARKNWFWGNALNPLDTRTVVKDFGGWREFSGKKSFCSGANDSEMLIASAVDERAGGKLLIAAIPSGRSGITLHDDWNTIGQRQTDSGSASFERVRVEGVRITARSRPPEYAVRLPAAVDRAAHLHPSVFRHCRRRLRRGAPLHPDRNPCVA
ncbi:alkylation response protein AidB-like acyl-CoA dehydrogenase [Pseudomonas sp. W4I3]|nr:alkylation response protein AidB-like acyl-CoA dehydrogenase [Pseudomonas sp. W4I3]